MASLRERLLQLLEELPEEEKLPAEEPEYIPHPTPPATQVQPVVTVDLADVIEPAPTASTSEGCPRCGSTQPMQAVPGGGRRCQPCGFQTQVNQPYGFSRRQALSSELDEIRTNFHPRGFFTALGRLGVKR